MNKGTSLYLDIVRFTAALLVFLDHLSGRAMSGGLIWRFHHYGTVAVSVFFILSGFVIAHVLATRERTLLEYSASRFGRLYSVVLPALAITLLVHTIDMATPNTLPMLHAPTTAAPIVQYIVTALFLNRAWVLGGFLGLEPTSDIPFWSLGFEVAYYIAIAAIVFGRGWARAGVLVILAIVSGPTIILLAPIWFLGFWLYHLQARLQVSQPVATALFVGGIAICIVSTFVVGFKSPWDLPVLMPGNPGTQPHTQLADFACRYISGAGFALNLIGFVSLSKAAEPTLARYARQIRWLGSLTFALYLFHQPVVEFLTVHPVGVPGSLPQLIWVVCIPLLVVVTVGRLCERSKGSYRRLFLRVFERPQPALAEP